MHIAGLIIDPQNDFCDPQGALYVGGAEEDMQRLARFVAAISERVGSLHVSMDAHHFADIAHPVWWQDVNSKHPEPFTIITPEDVDQERWRATQAEHQERSATYVHALSGHGRYPLCIWPPHCLIGHPGQNIVPSLAQALDAWEARTGRAVFYAMKGQNPFTEHYSAIRADVPDPADPATDTNRALVEILRRADLVFVAGEAGSHCVANTVRDLVDCWTAQGETNAAAKLVLLTDAISPVGGFENYQDAFLRDMAQLRVQTATTDTFEETYLQ